MDFMDVFYTIVFLADLVGVYFAFSKIPAREKIKAYILFTLNVILSLEAAMYILITNIWMCWTFALLGLLNAVGLIKTFFSTNPLDASDLADEKDLF